jgi:hypothetical protein
VRQWQRQIQEENDRNEDLGSESRDAESSRNDASIGTEDTSTLAEPQQAPTLVDDSPLPFQDKRKMMEKNEAPVRGHETEEMGSTDPPGDRIEIGDIVRKESLEECSGIVGERAALWQKQCQLHKKPPSWQIPHSVSRSQGQKRHGFHEINRYPSYNSGAGKYPPQPSPSAYDNSYDNSYDKFVAQFQKWHKRETDKFSSVRSRGIRP